MYLNILDFSQGDFHLNLPLARGLIFYWLYSRIIPVLRFHFFLGNRIILSFYFVSSGILSQLTYRESELINSTARVLTHLRSNETVFSPLILFSKTRNVWSEMTECLKKTRKMIAAVEITFHHLYITTWLV